MTPANRRQLELILAHRIAIYRISGLDVRAPDGELATARLLARDVSDWLRMKLSTYHLLGLPATGSGSSLADMPSTPSELEKFVADQKALADLLGAALLYVEEADTSPGTVDGVEVRSGDVRRARLRLSDGHETWSHTTREDLTDA